MRMALVSGRPISFQMNLYDPLYIARPMVEPELFASLRPVTYDGGMDKNWKTPDMPKPMDPRTGFSRQGYRGQKRGESKGGHDKKKDADYAEKLAKKLNKEMDLGSTKSVSQSGDLGDYFQYVIDHPVNLPRQKSAMLPIITQAVEGSQGQHLQRKDARQASALGPQVQEHQQRAPDCKARSRSSKAATTPATPAFSTCKRTRNG